METQPNHSYEIINRLDKIYNQIKRTRRNTAVIVNFFVFSLIIGVIAFFWMFIFGVALFA